MVVARPTKWGNRYRVGDRYLTDNMGHGTVRDRAHAVELFVSRQLPRMTDLARLRGKDLACWCPLDQPCHGDVLLEFANRPLVAVGSQGEG